MSNGRVFLPALAFALLVTFGFGVMYVQQQSVGSRLRKAEADNRVLAQQVRDLGGIPKVSPQPGPAGSPGASGSPGAPGASGAPGRTGPSGKPGRTGASGSPGKTGPSGAPGNPGAVGPSGPPGPAGKDGKDGADGKDGSPGPVGPSGPPGPTCPDGYYATHTTVVTAGGPQDAVICTAD
jgi:hypothetical protein